MRYEDVSCTACGGIFGAQDDVVVCPVCGAPHHRACWEAQGRCAMHDEHANGYTWVFPADVLKKREDARSENGEAPDGGEIIMKNGEAIINCPDCGSANYGNDIYCLRCGARLDGKNEDRAQDDRQYERNKADTFREIRYDFDRFGGISPDALVDGIPCAEYSDYVGGSRPGKIIRKVSTMERYGRKLSWLWSALLLGPVWFFWRKMKTAGIIVSMALVFFSALYGVLQVNEPLKVYYQQTFEAYKEAIQGEISAEELKEKVNRYTADLMETEETGYTAGQRVMLSVMEYCVFFGMPLACALLAIPLYRKKVKEHILEIRGECTNMEQYRNTLIAKGGTSAGGAVAGVLVLAAAAFCLFFLPIVICLLFM